MAVPKKGWRPVVVNERQYFWRAIGTDGGIKVVIVTEAAFARGASAQQLTFHLDYDHGRTALPGGAVRLQQRAAVAPGVIALAIQRAVASRPSFTGDIGEPSVALPPHVIGELQEAARVGTIRP